MAYKFKDTGNGEHRLHAAPHWFGEGTRQLLMTGSQEECLAEYRRLCEVQPKEFDLHALVVCDETGFPVCGA